MNVSAWSIRNPVPAILLFGLLSVFGIASFHSLGIQNFPDIELPTILVNATLEGAAPAQLETEVARKIEDKVATLGGVQHIHTTITDGLVRIAVEFQIDTPPEAALNDVRNAVDSIRADLPADLNPPVVSKLTTAGSPILTFSVQSDRMDEEALSWLVDNDISKAMLAVPGVGQVARKGGVDREIHVDLDPAKMAALGVTAADISARLRQVGMDASGGRGDIGGAVQSMRTLGAITDPRDLSALELPLADGRSLRLEDVARVSDGVAERSSYALLDGKPVVAFEVTRIKGASEVAVASAVRAAVARFQASHPLVHIAEAFNTVTPVEDNFHGSMELLGEGAALAVLVVWLFLRDLRATLVSATALPLSIIPTFLAMSYLGFSLNVLTLLALALVVGILVDDAIVEVENIVRHLRMGKTPFQAAMEAADEIGVAVIATTFTLVAVFMPTAFMGGIPGKFFRPFGLTAAVAVMASLLVARLLTPMMAAYLLKPHDEPNTESRLMRAYLRLAGWCLAHRKTTIALAALFFAASLALIPLLPSGFIPPADVSQTLVKLELQPGTSLDQTRALAERAREILSKDPDVRHIFTAVGSVSGGGPFGEGAGADVRKATLTVGLTPRAERPYAQQVIEARLRKALTALPGARVSLGAGHAGEKLQIVLSGDDPVALDQASRAVQRDLRTLQGVGNITSSASLQRPEVHIRPDYARAADLGVTSAALAGALRIATAGDYEMALPKLNLPQRQLPIRVRLDKSVRSDLGWIADLRVPGRSHLVPISEIAQVSLGSGPAQIDRLDRSRNVTFDIELAGRVIGEVQAEVDKLPSLRNLPPAVRQPVSGDAEIMKELFASFGSAMLIGILCIYVVLVLLFHDFLQPATILAALPLSVGGAFLALLVTHNAFSMPSVIGLLMLMGIVTKNSILLVEYAVRARRRGAQRLDALIDACRKRARPIVMTTIAMGAGMLPVALGWGADPSFRAPMAIVVVGGLLTSTFLSLLVIPVVFTYVDDLVRGLGWIARRAHSVRTPHAVEGIDMGETLR